MTTTAAAGQTTHLDEAIVGEGAAVMQLEGLWLRRVSWGVWVVGFGDWTSAASKAAWVIAVRGCGARAGLWVLWGVRGDGGGRVYGMWVWVRMRQGLEEGPRMAWGGYGGLHHWVWGW